MKIPLYFLLPLLLLPASIDAQPCQDHLTESIIRLSKDSFMIGEPLVFTYTVRNCIKTPQLLPQSHQQSWPLDVSITESGTTAHRPVQQVYYNQLGNNSSEPVVVQPGQSYEIEFCSSYGFKFKKPGSYKFSVKRAAISASDLFKFDGVYQSMIEAEVNFDVIPRDEAKLGRLIQKWGSEALKGNEKSSYLLDGATDERVIPYYDTLQQRKNIYSEGYRMINLLQKYGTTDVAFEILKRMIVNAGKTDPFGLGFIGNFKNKGVVPLLVSLKNDTSSFIRSLVMQKISHFDLTASRSVARELQFDSVEKVRKLALDFLKRVNLPEAPCHCDSVSAWIEMKKDTFIMGEPITADLVLHNCRKKEIYLPDRDALTAYVAATASTFNSGHTCFDEDNFLQMIERQNGIIIMMLILPGNVFRSKVLIDHWISVEEPGVYTVTLAGNVSFNLYQSPDNHKHPYAIHQIPVKKDIAFVVLKK